MHVSVTASSDPNLSQTAHIGEQFGPDGPPAPGPVEVATEGGGTAPGRSPSEMFGTAVDPGWDRLRTRGIMSGLLPAVHPETGRYAPLAQSAERFHGKEKVVSSILTGGSTRSGGRNTKAA